MRLRTWRAFTLVEILVVLALLALVVSALLPATGAWLRGAGGETAEDTALDTMQEIRRQAVLSGRTVTLRFDALRGALVWTDGIRTSRRALTGPVVTVDFLRPGGGAILLGGQLVETSPVREMNFYPDGTCDGIRVQLRPADGTPRVTPIDPWTCAPVLEAKQP